MFGNALKRTKRSSQQQALVDAAVTAYAQWRRECTAVWKSYHRWIAASVKGKTPAFQAYNDALDREEQAAKRYAGAISRVDAGLLRPDAGRHLRLAS